MHDFIEILGKGILPSYLQSIGIEGAVFIEELAHLFYQFPAWLIEGPLDIGKNSSIKDPVNQIILILKMVVKALPVHIAAFYYVPDADLFHGGVRP